MPATAALQTTRALLTKLLDGQSEYALVLDQEGRVMYASPSSERILGVSHAELMGVDGFGMGKHPDDVHLVREAYQRSLAHPGEPQHAEWRAQRRDGTWRHFAGTCRNLLDDPEVCGIVVNTRDVTEERRIAALLREAEARYRDILDTLPAMIYSVEPEPPYRPVFMSRGHTLLGYSNEEWMDPTMWTRVLHPDDRDRVLCEVERARAQHEPTVLEYRAIDKSGNARWLLDRGQFTYNADGKATAWRGSMRDVTEEVETRSALGASEDRYKQIFEDSFSANFVSTADGRFLSCNEAFARLMGYGTVEETLKSSAFDHHESRETRLALVERIARAGFVEGLELQVRRADGRTLSVFENARAVYDKHGTVVEIRGHIVDITERRRLEGELRQASKMEAVGRLAGGIAHDFNNLLSVIGSYTSLLLDDVTAPGAMRDDLLEVRRAVDRGAALIRQLLTFSRVRMPVATLIDVNAVIRETDRMVRRLLGPDCALVTELGSIDGLVSMDAGQLEQVLVNLLVNASDAMPSGGQIVVATSRVTLGTVPAGDPVVGMHERRDLRAGDYVRLLVSDNGVGMDVETAARAMDPFFTTKEVGAGTGLGLSTVYGIVAQAGGGLVIDSRPGEGTSVVIHLPVSAERETSAVAANVSNPAPQERGARILVVDDEEGVRKSLGRILERYRFDVVTVASASEALAAWADSAGGFDLLITDLRMPVMGGLELMKRLREMGVTVGMLAMSGYPEDNLLMPDAGVRFIAKPFEVEAIVAQVRELTARSRIG